MSSFTLPPAAAALLQQVTGRLNKAAIDLLGQAQLVESGLGQTPLQEHIQGLAYPPLASGGDAADNSLLIVGLSANSVAKTLSLWLGEDYFSCRALVPTRSSCFEIHAIEGQAWQIEDNRELSSFSSLGELSTALENHEKNVQKPASGSQAADRLLIRIPSPAGRKTRIFVPASLDTLRSKASLMSWLGDQALLVLLIGHDDDKIDSTTIETLQPLVTAVGALRHLVVSSIDGSKEIPAWVRTLNAPVVLPTIHLHQSFAHAVGTMDAERMVVLELSRLRQLEGACHLVLDSLATLVTSTNNRRRLTDPSRNAGPIAVGIDSNARSQVDKILRPFMGDLEQIRRSLEESSARSMGAEGALYQAIQRIVDDTTFESLRQENLAHTIRLSLGAGTTDHIRSLVRKEFSKTLREDLRDLTEAVDASVEDLRNSLSEKTGFTHRLHTPEADLERMTETLSTLVQVNIRYKGEIPRATWKTRFQGARNWMMGVSMFMMLTAGIGALTSSETAKTLREVLMVGMLAAFIMGLMAAIFGYKRLRAEAIDREMDKFKDAAMQELGRLFQSLSGEKRRVAAEHLQKVGKEIELEIGRVLAQTSESARVESERSRADAAEKTRLLDNRLRSYQQAQLSCRQVENELRQVQAQLGQVVATFAAPAPTAAAPGPAAPPAAPPPAAFTPKPPVQPAPPASPPPPATLPKPPPAVPSPVDSFSPPPVVTQNIP